MKGLLFIAVSLGICYSISAQDFRKASWGDSKAEVKATEDLKILKDDCIDPTNCILIYETMILGDDVNLWYQFLYGKLCATSYQFTPSSSTEKPYSQLKKFIDQLEIKYGPPSQVKWDWKDINRDEEIINSIDKDDTYKVFLYLGDLKSVTYMWQTEQTVINLFSKLITIGGSEGLERISVPNLTIQYNSYEYFRMIEKSRKDYTNDVL